MSAGRRPADLAASVRARLLNLSRERGMEFQRLLSEFAIERLLFRLGESPSANRFVLKGAMLFKLWSDDRRRATWDLDLQGKGSNDVGDVAAAIRELCSMRVEDGIAFDLDSIVGEEIRVADEYAGVRVRLEARLADARIPVQVDVGFGDPITPSAELETYPTLLDHDAPRILVYPRETVVAEKLETMISLGVTNSRMKDFYDVHTLASSFAFDGLTVATAIRATFERRGTPCSEAEPLVLTRGFLSAPERQTQWRAFLGRARLDGPRDAEELAESLSRFLLPVLAAASRGETFAAWWPAGGPWQQEAGS